MARDEYPFQINKGKSKGGDECIKEVGFDKSFTNHIMKCVQSVHYQIHS